MLGRRRRARAAGRPQRSAAAVAADVLGRALVAAGTVGLLFVAHEQWVTGWRHERAQAQLRAALTAAPQQTPADKGGATSGARPSAPGAVLSALDGVPARAGTPLATLRIPTVDVETVVVEGADIATLRDAPGRIASSAPLGAQGASVVAGHRTTWGAPFADLDRLRPGDVVDVTQGPTTWRYRVTSSRITTPRDAAVLQPAATRTLRLVTCHPRFSAAQRLVVDAVAVEATPERPTTRSDPGPQAAAVSGADSPGTLGAAGPPSIAAALLPGAAAAAVWVLGSLLAHGRRRRAGVAWRVAAAAVAALPLLVAFDRLDAVLHA